MTQQSLLGAAVDVDQQSLVAQEHLQDFMMCWFSLARTSSSSLPAWPIQQEATTK